jgi:pyridoxal phosphate enzyme (YggS family)
MFIIDYYKLAGAFIMENFDHVKKNIDIIQTNINKINKEIKLLVVTKTFPAEAVEAAINEGLREFGESRIQEAEEKIILLNEKHKDLKWHFIGHLQSNKVNKTVKLFDVIQSVDDIKLAEKISGSLKSESKEMNVLLELKISDETTKFGLTPDDILKAAESVAALPDIKVNGLMAMAPYFEDPQEARPYFRKARKIFDELRKNRSDSVPMEVLSMGMSNDYVIAAQEGSTMVRIGTAIFGKRDHR